jgi:hypothetical protein
MSHLPASRSTGHVIAAATIGMVVVVFEFVAVAIGAVAFKDCPIAGDGRAVMFAVGADAAIVLGSTIALAHYARTATPLARWSITAGFALGALVMGAGFLLMTVFALLR